MQIVKYIFKQAKSRKMFLDSSYERILKEKYKSNWDSLALKDSENSDETSFYTDVESQNLETIENFIVKSCPNR